ncbi:MAG: hypothetical protein NXH95_16900 [Pseudomonadaceae bacterium]|nr:hypothetical protein [Pseudomonadaceae bacterium]
MRLIFSLIALICASPVVAGAADSGTLNASDLSTASIAELDDRKSQAVQANQALATLLEGVTSEAAPVDTAQPEADKKTGPSRSSVPREDEQALARIPGEIKQGSQTQTFANLRKRLTQLPSSEAQTLIAGFLKDHPDHREATITLARMQILENQPSTAIETLDFLVSSVANRRHPDWQPWFWAGTAYLELGEIEAARRMLELAVAKEGKVAEIWVQLAVVEQELDNHAAALQYIGIAEQVDAEAALVHLNRAYSLERLGEFDAALNAYRQFMSSEMSAGSEALRPSVMRRMALLAEHQQAAEQDSDRSS